MLDVALDTHFNTFHLQLSFQAKVGKTTVLLGESGAGKSSVLKLVAGLQRPEQGHIELERTVYYNSQQRIMVPAQERPFGYVFQEYMLFPHLSVFENVAFGLRAKRRPRQEIKQRVLAALEMMRLVGFEERRPGQLSGGQQQRVAIARALVLQPELLLLDEPLAALDVQTRREIRQELRSILAETKITTLLVTHQYVEALLFGQQILVLDGGRIVQQGEPGELGTTPRSAYMAELVGVNFFQGTLRSYEAESICVVQLAAGDGGNEIVATLEERVSRDARLAPGTEISVMVEPRSITLYQTLPPTSSARNVFQGRILHLLHLGHSLGREDGRVRISIMTDTMTKMPLTAEITEASAARMELEEGGMVYATFKASEARAYI